MKQVRYIRLIAGLVAGLALWPRRAAAGQGADSEPAAPDHELDQQPEPELEPEPEQLDQPARNELAFLAMIRTAEGTADADGYRALFGHTKRRPRLFESFEDHPRQAAQFTDKAGRRLWTSAAGAYQFMAASQIPGGGWTKVDTWTETKRRIGLPDFSPESQDAAALELIRQAGALGDVRAGRFQAAVHKVRGRWASLPGAGYDQHEQSLNTITAAYRAAGGKFA